MSRVYTRDEARAAGILPAADPPKSKPIQHETELAVAVAAFLRTMAALGLLRCRWTHVANERRDRMESIRSWRMGLEPGAPDYVFFLPAGLGAVIELKRPDGKGSLSPEQRAWRDDLLRLGWKWKLAESVAEVEAALKEWNVLSTKKETAP